MSRIQIIQNLFLIKKINDFQKKLECLSDQQLKDKTQEFKLFLSQKISSCSDNRQEENCLDQILPEVFATAKEAFKRSLDIKLTNQQLIGAFYLHKSNIVEMQLGEGREFAIFLSAYLNSLTQKGVHIALINEFNVFKQLSLLKLVYDYLGITVNPIFPNGNENIREIYQKSDIIYSTLTQLALNYLIDSKSDPQSKIQKKLNYIIVDNADKILIDLAPTNFSISQDGHIIDRPITIEDFFNKYPKNSGITTTVGSEKKNFEKLYNINTIIIPTDKKTKRVEIEDILYRSEIIKYRNILEEIKTIHQKQRPILIAIENEEKLNYLLVLLKKNNLPYKMVSREMSQQDMQSIATAGKKGSITIINGEMALDLDIKLGGDFEYFARKELKQKNLSENSPHWDEELKKELKKQKELMEQEAEKISEIGGLHVIGTGHYKSERYDDKLKQQSAQKGYKGSYRFFTSLEDGILKTIGIDSIKDKIISITKNSDVTVKTSFWLKIISYITKNAQRKLMRNNKIFTNYDISVETSNSIPTNKSPKIERNSPCPCGSGKKYKNCCMKKENL